MKDQNTNVRYVITVAYCVLFFLLLGVRGFLPEVGHRLANLAIVLLSVGLIAYLTVSDRRMKKNQAQENR